ncbi:MAG: hypothetical protein U9O53_01260 [archaeon]|nr:hypothetical protein [archaeon]
MDKKIRFISILFICLLVLSGCTSEEVPFQDNSETADSSLDAGSIPDISSLTEYEKYALFEAENTCILMGTKWWDSEETEKAADDIASILEKYSFSDADMELLRAEYSGDKSFESTVVKFMDILCPEYIGALYPYEGTDIGDTSSLTEKERYALFAADGTCYYMSVCWWDQEDVERLVNKLESLPEKHGIPYDDVILLKEKYKDDNSFETMLIEEIERFCPESAAMLDNLNAG